MRSSEVSSMMKRVYNKEWYIKKRGRFRKCKENNNRV